MYAFQSGIILRKLFKVGGTSCFCWPTVELEGYDGLPALQLLK